MKCATDNARSGDPCEPNVARRERADVECGVFDDGYDARNIEPSPVMPER